MFFIFYIFQIFCVGKKLYKVELTTGDISLFPTKLQNAGGVLSVLPAIFVLRQHSSIQSVIQLGIICLVQLYTGTILGTAMAENEYSNHVCH